MSSSIKKLTIIISSEDHPVNSSISDWACNQSKDMSIEIIRSVKQAKGGDLCFLISCTELVPNSVLRKYKNVLVIHASDLPQGRGWSPHIWDILNGNEKIVVSLLEAAEKVDCGDIWKKYSYKIPRYFLYNDIIAVVNKAHIDLMDFAIKNFDNIKPKPQSKKIKPSYYPKRFPKDSEICPSKSIKEQFNNLRVSDKNRFPSYFYLYGKKFKIYIEREDE